MKYEKDFKNIDSINFSSKTTLKNFYNLNNYEDFVILGKQEQSDYFFNFLKFLFRLFKEIFFSKTTDYCITIEDELRSKKWWKI